MCTKNLPNDKFDGVRDEQILISRDDTETLEVALVRMKKGGMTEEHVHEDEEQVYVVLDGKASFTINGAKKELRRGMVVFVPRQAVHEVVCESPDGLSYVYVANWPDKKGKGQQRKDSPLK